MLHQCLLRHRAPSVASGVSTVGVQHSINHTLHALRTRDITLRVPSKDRLARVVFCSTRSILRETIEQHDLVAATGGSVPFLGLVGSHITFTNLLASLQDGEERVESRFTGDEATVNTTALALGECKAYLSPAHNAELVETGGLQAFPLKVDRILYNQRQAFSSTVNAQYPELVSAAASRVISERDDLRKLAATYLKTGSLPSEAFEGSAEWALPPLYSLELQDVHPDKLVPFFSYNLTLHGYNYFRRSDGSVSALGLHSSVDGALLATLGAKPARKRRSNSAVSNADSRTADGSESTEEEAAAKWRAALRAAVPASYGFLVQPLAAGNKVDWTLWKLQRAVVMALAEGVNGGLAPLLARTALPGATACQDWLSLVTGDYEGAFEAAVVARQYTDDPSNVAAVVEPIRAKLGICDVNISLDGKEANRTGLDFFCRCSSADLLASLIRAPESVVRSLEEENIFKCTYCGKSHHPTPSEWKRLHEMRGQRTNA